MGEADEDATRVDRHDAGKVLACRGQVVVAELLVDGTQTAATRFEERAIPAHAPCDDRLAGRKPVRRLEIRRADVFGPQRRRLECLGKAPVDRRLDWNGPVLGTADARVAAAVTGMEAEDMNH